MNTTQAYLSGNGDNPQALIVVFLRGGADGLSLVAPLEDDNYYRARPRLAVSKTDAMPLDGFFGLNPFLQDLLPIYKDGALTIIHGAGSEDTTRSHFEAQDLMEHGGVAAGGWLGRFLRYRTNTHTSALSAIAVGRQFPECLRGAPAAMVMQSIDEFSLGVDSGALLRELDRLYEAQPNALGLAGRDTLDALRRIEKLRTSPYHPSSDADYPRNSFAEGLKQVARLLKGRLNLEAVSIDLGGWDSHFTQGTIIDPLMTRLAKGLAAFYRDMGSGMATTTIVVMTEFGRRVAENASFGTDHGRGSVMFVIGGGVRGGRVLGQWGGLQSDLLEGPGDVPVWTNYQNVLAPILQKHSAGSDLALIFPEFPIEPVNLYG